MEGPADNVSLYDTPVVVLAEASQTGRTFVLVLEVLMMACIGI